MTRILREPDPEAALAFLREAILALDREGRARGRLVQAIGECRVRYQGRARSDLHAGERLVLLKPDGTLLIHSAEKAKPVNWQPPGAVFHADLEEGRLVLTAHRLRPEEIVRVEFTRLDLLLSVPLRDGAELALVGSEDDLQELLFARPALVEEGFVPRRRERESGRGFYDLDGDDAQGRRLLVEVKRTTAGLKEAQQLWRYVEPLRNGQADRVRGMLVAPRIADKARAYLREHGLEWRELSWDELLPRIEALRRTGQAHLGRFG